MATNHRGDPLGSIFGPMGSHWVQKMGQKRKNYHAPKFEFSIFPKKWKLRLWRQIMVGTPYGLSWGQWGPIGSKKWVKSVKNYHAPKFEFFAKNGSYGYGAKSRWGPRGVYLGGQWGRIG